jgi:dihydrolipoamide dehydrogenase
LVRTESRVQQYDLIVIGAGPGGYVAAIRASQLGLKTAIIEKSELGGVCLNWGCIPSKALLRNAEVVSLVKRADEFGISYDNLKLDYSKAVDRSRAIVSRLTRSVASLVKKNSVEHLTGEARIVDPHTVGIAPSGQYLITKNIIIAAGARPRSIPALPVDGKTVLTSREAIVMTELPASVAIVGGGPIGVEFAYILNAYGVNVVVIEMLPHLVPLEDEEMGNHIERALTKQGIGVLTNSTVTRMEKTADGAKLFVESSGGEHSLKCQKVIVAIGVQPNTENMGLEKADIQTNKGFVSVDERMRTNVQGIYAVGDVTGKMLLAHVASAQGVLAAETIAGRESRPLDYTNMPKAVYCNPQLASFGLTEKAAQEQGLKVKVGRFSFRGNGKALGLGESEGVVKLVFDAELGAILGAHMVGPEVTEILPELSMTQLLEGTSTELGWLVHPHPSLSEAVKEAALAAEGQAIHL